MWDLNFGTWISHRGFTVAFGNGHPLVYIYIAIGVYIWENPKKELWFFDFHILAGVGECERRGHKNTFNKKIYHTFN
jgi:hypothetical protein